VIGSDGTIYKCTVALDSDFNKVGQLLEDGSMKLNSDLMALWITSDETADESCQKCFFRPSCQGAACPKIRIEKGKKPCPPDKIHIKDVMKLAWKQYKMDSDKEKIYEK
ncbi:SPASM domain-containing protein, partial [Bacillaceae bacterium Marseille-Q3522]|nr:SPASM domain-containing protein [Bacillaceae bacterium Marseille-Q3522]